MSPNVKPITWKQSWVHVVTLLHKGRSTIDLVGGVSWTMPHEYYDSMVLYLVTSVVVSMRKYSLGLALCVTAFAIYLGSHLASFMVGYVITMLSLRGYFHLSRIMVAFVMTLLFYQFCKYTMQVPVDSDQTFLHNYILWPNTRAIVHGLYPSALITSTMFMIIVECSTTLQMFFRNAISSFLGRISFMMYLYHMIIILKTINENMTGLHLEVYNVIREKMIPALLRRVLLETLIFSYTFTLLVDEPTIEFLRVASDIINPKRDLTLKDTLALSVQHIRNMIFKYVFVFDVYCLN